MDKLFKKPKKEILQKFEKAASLLKYSNIEFNPVTEKFCYTKKGTGMRWGSSADISVSFIEKDGLTNASFSCTNSSGLPLAETFKQKLLKDWYQELIDAVDKLSTIVETTENTDDKILDKEKKDTSKVITSKEKNIEKEIAKKVQSNDKKSTNVKYFFAAVFLAIGLLFYFVLPSGDGDSGSSGNFVFESLSEYNSEILGQTQLGVKSILGVPDLQFETRGYDTWSYECMIYDPITEKGCGIILIFNETNRKLGELEGEWVVGRVTKSRCSDYCD